VIPLISLIIISAALVRGRTGICDRHVELTSEAIGMKVIFNKLAFVRGTSCLFSSPFQGI
jgi:hypothetical protein